MQSRPWLNIQANETVIVELQSTAREKEFNGPSGSYTKWIYDVLHEDKEKSIGATKGLQGMLEANSFRVGDVIKITRAGEGLNTRWLVGLERGDPSAPIRNTQTQTRPGLSVDDLWGAYDGFCESLRLRNPNLSEDAVGISAAVLAVGSVTGGISLPAFGATAENNNQQKMSPTAYIKQLMTLAKIPLSSRDMFARFLFGEHIDTLDNITREDAETIYLLTENGKKPELLMEQYERMTGGDADAPLPF